MSDDPNGDPIEQLRAHHRALGEQSRGLLRQISNMAATAKVVESIDESSLEGAFEGSRDTLRALGEFLDSLHDAVDRALAPQDQRLTFSTLADTVAELEERPELAPGQEPSPPEPGASSGEGAETGDDPFASVPPLQQLAAPYGILLDLEQMLYSERIRRPFLLGKLKELWADVTHAGGDHPSGGLVPRLGQLPAFVESAETGDVSEAPWRVDDREAVRSLSDRAATIADWDPDQRRRREREAWHERVESWVETAESNPDTAGHMNEMLTRFLTDAPRQLEDDDRELIERIADNDALPTSVTARAERLLS